MAHGEDQQSIRKIIHIDMDAFFASVEQRDFPELRGKPVAVGGSSRRGVVAAASYEARKYGVHSAMASAIAVRKCPQLIFVKHRFEVYREVSMQIREIFHRYTDLVEPLSLDEAYLDVTENKMGIRSAMKIAMLIKEEIFAETKLTASAGVSFNKFLAKMASDLNKPNGMATILPQEADAFLEALPIEKFHGIGKVTAEKMKRLGINNGRELKAWSEVNLLQKFGKVGRHYYRIVRAEDYRPVNPERIRKSVGAERTFSTDLYTEEEIREQLTNIVGKVVERLNPKQIKGKTVTLKLKYNDFTVNTRSKTLMHWVYTESEILRISLDLLHDPFPEQPIRLLGIALSSLNLTANLQGEQLEIPF